MDGWCDKDVDEGCLFMSCSTKHCSDVSMVRMDDDVGSE